MIRSLYRYNMNDFTVDSELKNKIVHYDKKKSFLVSELKKLVREGIEEYRSKEIEFGF